MNSLAHIGASATSIQLHRGLPCWRQIRQVIRSRDRSRGNIQSI